MISLTTHSAKIDLTNGNSSVSTSIKKDHQLEDSKNENDEPDDQDVPTTSNKRGKEQIGSPKSISSQQNY